MLNPMLTCLSPVLPPPSASQPTRTMTLLIAEAGVTVRECKLPPAANPTTLHAHTLPEAICVVAGEVGILYMQDGKARQERVPTGGYFVVPAHALHVEINLGLATARYLSVLARPTRSGEVVV